MFKKKWVEIKFDKYWIIKSYIFFSFVKFLKDFFLYIFISFFLQLTALKQLYTIKTLLISLFEYDFVFAPIYCTHTLA